MDIVRKHVFRCAVKVARLWNKLCKKEKKAQSIFQLKGTLRETRFWGQKLTKMNQRSSKQYVKIINIFIENIKLMTQILIIIPKQWTLQGTSVLVKTFLFAVGPEVTVLKPLPLDWSFLHPRSTEINLLVISDWCVLSVVWLFYSSVDIV